MTTRTPLGVSQHGSHTRGSRGPFLLRHVRRDVVVLGSGSLIAIAAQLVFRSILVATLTPLAYGRLSLILGIYNFAWIIGVAGLPTTVSRYIALVPPMYDGDVIRCAVRAGAIPTISAALLIGAAAALILQTWIAFPVGMIGLSSLMVAMVLTGVLRGRKHFGAAASVIPTSGISEVVILLALLAFGFGVTPIAAFAVFSAGNIIGFFVGVGLTWRTSPKRNDQTCQQPADSLVSVPSPRELLAFSAWLGIAVIGVAALPLVIRVAAVLSSYELVAVIDIALLLLSAPNQLGSIVLSAVVPHAARALRAGSSEFVLLARRDQLIVTIPFFCLTATVMFTPFVRDVVTALGRPEYAKSATYLALALLASPPRILYGLVEGLLVARDDGRFLAANSLSVALAASLLIMGAAVVGSMIASFLVFVVASWVLYGVGLRRLASFARTRPATLDYEMAAVEAAGR